MHDSLTRTFAALADPTRRAILAELSEGSLTVNELVGRHHLSQPAISKHLKVLEEAGLVTKARDAQRRPCSLNPEGMKAAAGWIDRYRHHWEDAFGRMDAFLASLKETPDA